MAKFQATCKKKARNEKKVFSLAKLSNQLQQ
jgi:hypothetical protein